MFLLRRPTLAWRGAALAARRTSRRPDSPCPALKTAKTNKEAINETLKHETLKHTKYKRKTIDRQKNSNNEQNKDKHNRHIQQRKETHPPRAETKVVLVKVVS